MDLAVLRAFAKYAASAVIIKGNPRWVKDNPRADAFYDKLGKHLKRQGYAVAYDAGEPHTSPPKADLWVGHSRGIDRLRFAPKGTKTVALGHDAGIAHPKDNTRSIHGPSVIEPNKYHYAVTNRMRAALTKKAEDE